MLNFHEKKLLLKSCQGLSDEADIIVSYAQWQDLNWKLNPIGDRGPPPARDSSEVGNAES